MTLILAWLADLVSSPLVTKLVVPILGDALAKFFEKRAAALEVKSAVKAASAAKTAEEFREASRRLTEASNRPK